MSSNWFFVSWMGNRWFGIVFRFVSFVLIVLSVVFMDMESVVVVSVFVIL